MFIIVFLTINGVLKRRFETRIQTCIRTCLYDAVFIASFRARIHRLRGFHQTGRKVQKSEIYAFQNGLCLSRTIQTGFWLKRVSKHTFFGRFKTARLNAYQNALVFIAGYKFSKLSFKTLFRRFKRGDKHTPSDASLKSRSEITV